MDHLQAMQGNNLVYKAPPVFWWQGYTLGNGSGGATLWNPPDQLCAQLGHTDLLDRTIDTGLDACGIPNTRHHLRFALHITDVPLFDTFYLKEYEAVTELGTGLLRCKGASQFGSFAFESVYCAQPDVFALRYADKTEQSAVRSLRLERLGSRFFARIWTGTDPDTAKGIGTTTIEKRGDVVLLSNQCNEFCMAAAVTAQSACGCCDRIGAYHLERRYEESSDFAVEIRVTLGIASTVEAAQAAAVAKLSACKTIAFDALATAKAEALAQELPDVYVRLPQDAYYENLWYTSRYHMRNCYKGKYPAFFINGPFGGDRDKREWADCWLHWNLHASHLGIVKSGDWDLFRTYADYKMRQIPSAKTLARTVYGCGGMVTQDQQRPDGGNRGLTDDYYKLSIFPCLHTSLQFNQYWRFTGDAAFLRDYLYPYLRLTLEFWRDYLVEDDDGTLHVPRSHPYEFHNGYGFRDCLVDLSLLKSCLAVYKAAAEALAGETADPLYAWCTAAQEHLAQPKELPVLRDHVTRAENGNRMYDNPFFYGEPYSEDDRVLAIGFSERVNDYVTSSHTQREINDPDVKAHGGYGSFCSSQSVFVYPANLISSDAAPAWRAKRGVSTADAALWDEGRNALRCIRRFYYEASYRPTFLIDHLDTMAWTGHSLDLPAFARLGLTEQLRKAMQFYTENYQMFPQGMFNYHPRNRWLTDHGDSTLPSGEERRIDFMPFCQHFSFEELGIFTETVDLMLLDSADGVLRLFGAYERDARFRLPAEGGFRVEALQKDGTVRFVSIASQSGQTCRVRLAWDTCFLHDRAGTHPIALQDSLAVFETTAGETYLLTPTADAASATDEEFLQQTAQPRKNFNTTLGLLRRF